MVQLSEPLRILLGVCESENGDEEKEEGSEDGVGHHLGRGGLIGVSVDIEGKHVSIVELKNREMVKVF